MNECQIDHMKEADIEDARDGQGEAERIETKKGENGEMQKK